MTHICVRKLTVIGSDHGLSPGRRQAIIWSNAGILLIGPLRTHLMNKQWTNNEIIIEIHTFSFKKIHLKMSSEKWRPFCLGLNVLSILPEEYGCVPILKHNKTQWLCDMTTYLLRCHCILHLLTAFNLDQTKIQCCIHVVCWVISASNEI